MWDIIFEAEQQILADDKMLSMTHPRPAWIKDGVSVNLQIE